MNYKECLAHCIAKAQEAGKHWQVAYLEDYPTPTEHDWAQCIAGVATRGNNSSNALQFIQQYERLLKTRGIKTIPAVESRYKKIARKSGVPAKFLDDFIMLTQMMHGNRTIL